MFYYLMRRVRWKNDFHNCATKAFGQLYFKSISITAFSTSERNVSVSWDMLSYIMRLLSQKIFKPILYENKNGFIHFTYLICKLIIHSVINFLQLNKL